MSFPEWAAPGKTVAVLSGYRSETVMLRKVERHTKTQVVLDNDARFKIHRFSNPNEVVESLDMIGGAGYYSTKIVDPESPKAQGRILAGLERSAWGDVERAVTSYGHDRDNPDKRAGMIDAIARHADALAALEEHKSQA